MKNFKKIALFVMLCLGASFTVTAHVMPTPHHHDDGHNRAYIEIRSNPDGAAVYVDGRYEGVAPLRVEVQPDVNHWVEVSKPGYKNEKKSVKASAGSVSSVSFYLDDLPSRGDIKVSVNNASGCSVYLNGSYKGKAPLTIKDLNPGRYKIRVSKSNLEDEYKTVTVTAGEVTRVDFSMKLGELRVYAPGVNDASVYVDGKYMGTTPYHGRDLEPGYHDIKVTKNHYKTWESSVRIKSGYTQTLHANLERLAELYVRASNTTGASVYLNGRHVGTTPYHSEDLDGGYYTVKLVKKHYRTEEFSFYLENGVTKNLNLDMTKISGYLTVDVTPSNSLITVDGETYSPTMELDEGTHQVRIQSFGYEDKTTSVDIIRNRYHTLEESLVPRRFDVTSFQVESSSLVRFKWDVTAPGSGVISVMDSSGAEIISWNVEFDSWNQYMEWDKKIGGMPVNNGSYTAILRAGGFERTSTFVISNGNNPYSNEHALESARQKVSESMEKTQDSGGISFLAFDTEKLFESKRTGFFLSLDCGGKSGGDYEVGGTFTASWSPIPFTIFGGEVTFTRGVNSSYPSADVTNFASAHVIAGLTCTLGSFRPYVYVGAGYCGYFAMPGDLKSGASGSDLLASGLSLEIVPGIDFLFDRWSLGVFYRGRQDMETGNYSMFGVSVGINL